MKKSIGIIGGGLSGLAAAEKLSVAGFDVTIYEKDDIQGGVAKNYTHTDGRVFPVTYHQIVGTDEKICSELKRLGLFDKVVWKRIKIRFFIDGRIIDLSNPFELLLYRELSLWAKFKFAYFGIRCILQRNWDKYETMSLAGLIDKWGNKEVHDKVFRRLVKIKFGMDTEELSASWLGMRLGKREAKTKFGYIPGTSWTGALINSYKERVLSGKGQILLRTPVEKIFLTENGIEYISVNGKRVSHDYYIITIDPPACISITDNPRFYPPEISAIEYISSYSLIAGIPEKTFKDYWTIAFKPEMSFGGCFVLDNLNETYRSSDDESVIICFTNTRYKTYGITDDEYARNVQDDLSKMLGKKIKFNWHYVSRIHATAPVFKKGYRNPDFFYKNIFFAGIYTTYPLLSSTGTAIKSGHDAADALIDKIGGSVE